MDEPRRFGARVHRTQAPSGQRFSSSASPHYTSNTPAFENVADRARRSEFNNHSNRISWTGEGQDDFQFSDDRHTERKDQGGHSDKYISSRPKASGQTIGTPGSSIVRPKSTSVIGDAVLNNVFKPPTKQNDFLTQITMQNTNRNRGSGSATKRLSAYQSPSSLEIASAPAPRKDISQPPKSSSGWVNTRPAKTPSKPRIQLESTEKRLKLNNERKTSSPGTNKYTLRDRTRSRLSEYSPLSPRPLIFRSPPTRLGKRKKNSEGSASMPIALDSDSDSESEVQSISSSKSATNTEDEGLDDSQKNGEKEVQEEKQAVVNLEDIEAHSMARIHNCDVMIGLFQCIANLLFQGDRMCMRNIRAKYDKWPFKSYYLFRFKDLRDVGYYDVSKQADASNEIDVEETGRMEQLLDEASFLAFKCPLPVEADRAAMRSFYDPSSSDASKAYFVLRPLEDATGSALDDIIDHLRAQTDIIPINEKDQAKKHLQALVKDPFIYLADRRSRRWKNTDETEDSLSESDEDDIGGNVTVLTYPLPPCTSDIVTIIGHDVSRLKPRRYLNDNIIDYYFKRMMLESFRDNDTVQEKVLFLSSHFYSRLRAGKGPTSSARMEAGYKNVSTWLARSNFFKRSIIFIPINKDVHWSLAVILNPGLAGSDLCNEDDAFSCIAVLDPLGSYHRKAAIIRNLRAFLRMEWESSRGRSGDDEAESASEYGIDRVLTRNVKVPLQENSYDCGVYVLKFAEVILKNCLELGLLAENGGVINKEITDDNLDALITSSAFSAEDIRTTRRQIRKYIEVDASEHHVRKKEKEKEKAAKAQA